MVDKRETRVVRVNLQNKKRGNVLGNITMLTPLGTFRFKNAKWFEVRKDLVPYLEDVYQNQEDPDSKPAFTIAKDKDDAKKIVQREKELEERRMRKSFTRRSFHGENEDMREIDLNEKDAVPKPEEPEYVDDDLGEGDTTSGDVKPEGSVDDGEVGQTYDLYSEDELEVLKISGLKDLCKEFGVEMKGSWKKSDYVAAILEAQE